MEIRSPLPPPLVPPRQNSGYAPRMDYGALSSWIAASISATAMGATLWLRRRDRPEPDWLVDRGAIEVGRKLKPWVTRPGENPDPDLVAMVTNVGDGAAYRVEVTGVGCEIRTLQVDDTDKRGANLSAVVARVEPGDTFVVLIWSDFGSLPSERSLQINWRYSPTRHQSSGAVTVPFSEVRGFPADVE